MTKIQIYLIVLLILFAITVRIGFVCLYSAEESFQNGINSPPVYDGVDYDALALTLLRSGTYGVSEDAPSAERPPGYPAFLATIYAIGGHKYYVVRIVQAVLSALTLIYIFKIAKSLFNEKIAFLSCLWFAIYPLSIYLSGKFFTETIFLFLLLIAIYYLITFQVTGRLKFVILSGIGLGLCTYVRPFMLIFPLFLFIWSLVLFVKNRKIFFKSMLIILVIMCVITPWIVRNYKIYGEFVPISRHGSVTFLQWNNPFTDGSHIVDLTFKDDGFKKEYKEYFNKHSSEGYKYTLNWVAENPSLFIKACGKRLIRFWHFYSFTIRENVAMRYFIVGLLSYGIFIPFVFFGISLSLRDWKKYLIIYLVILHSMLIATFISTGIRKRFVIDPLLIMFAVYSIDYLILKMLPRIKFKKIEDKLRKLAYSISPKGTFR